MTVIHVPRPSKNAMNPDRPVNALLLAQIQHLQDAERRLPLRYRSEIYTHAIKTEGEAAAYIKAVTEAIHKAHKDAEAQRAKRARKPERGIAIAAAAAPRPPRKGASKTTAKKKNNKPGRRK
jgi:hypothetical protein